MPRKSIDADSRGHSGYRNRSLDLRLVAWNEGQQCTDTYFPHWFRCDLCGQDVAEILPAEALDLVSLLVSCCGGRAEISRQTPWPPGLMPRTLLTGAVLGSPAL